MHTLTKARSRERSPDLKTVAPAVLILLTGLLYFSRFYNHGFNITDEGSLVLTASRLLAGERPFLDIETGYGPLWFYPLVLLFKLTGVSFIVARIYFLCLALTTALLAFLTVRRHTGKLTLATVVALAVLAIPGTLHKAYIPLMVVANMLFLPSLRRDEQALSRSEVFTAGLVVAVSYHVRPEIGLCAALALIATLAVHTTHRLRGWPQRIREATRLGALLGAAALVPTAPLTLTALNQGFVRPFVESLLWPFWFALRAPGSLAAAIVAPDEAPEAGQWLARAPLAAIWERGAARSLAMLTYLPLLFLAVIAAYACFLLVRKGGRSACRREAVELLVLLGVAYSAFPQFFVFRPDGAHLSQFMPGYLVLGGIFLGRWIPAAQDPAPCSSATPTWDRAFHRSGRTLLGSLFILQIAFYAWFGLHQPSTGSIALARGRTQFFQGANGVRVFVSATEEKLFANATRIIIENTDETDSVLCFPYCPGFNVMADRRSFARRLYADDSLLILEPDWQARTIRRIEAERPPLIIIQDWAINGTEISRFQNWATQLMEHIESEYVMSERIGSFWFYLRREPL